VEIGAILVVVMGVPAGPQFFVHVQLSVQVEEAEEKEAVQILILILFIHPKVDKEVTVIIFPGEKEEMDMPYGVLLHFV
jgi:hypothetical protein